METFREYLARHVVVTDGAMGTYLSSLMGRSAVACEMLNLTRPDMVRRVHAEYVHSGAKLLLTNTFCASSPALGIPAEQTARVLRAGVELARQAAGEQAWVAGDIGPLPENLREETDTDSEYRRMADVFLGEGVRIFQMETFGEAETPVRIARYIRSRLPEAFISVSFAVTPDGYSRLGHTAAELIDCVRQSGCVDAAGFNCCSGPAHMLRFALQPDYGPLIPAIRPNAGYPQMQDDVLVYSGLPEYFAEQLAPAAGKGFRLIGGCCGTTPAHIRFLARQTGASGQAVGAPETRPAHPAEEPARPAQPTVRGRRTVVVELDPPFDADIDRMEQAARLAKAAGADALTIADSPMAKPRADSAMIAARLRRVVGIDVIPHVCCRDRNLNAIKSVLLAAHIEGIRRVLAVTGDPVPETDRGVVKSVYNLNSVGLCGFIRQMNRDVFRADPVRCGCAFNVNAAQPGPELERLGKKVEAGASFVLTQPVFRDESFRALQEAHTLFAPKGVRFYAGILIPLSYKNARFLANEMPGFRFSQAMADRFTPDMTREEGERTGAGIALETARRAAPFADGFYFIAPFNRVGAAARVIAALREEGLV